MACIYIEIKERTEREKKSVPQREKDGKHHCTARRRRVTASKALQPAKRSERMVGSFLRKSERKFSRKREKKKKTKTKTKQNKKRRNGEVLNQSPKQLETSGKPNNPTN